MRTHQWFSLILIGGIALCPTVALPSGLSVDVSTDRGDEAVYQPGEALEVTARCSDDAYLLVYEIDAEGYVHVLFPYRQGSNLIEGRRDYSIPRSGASDELVVEGPVGQCYVVALASTEPLRDLPWYLRARNAQAEELGYYGRSDEEEGVTAEGRIVGDPFVAMERIRRRVLEDPDDQDSFATAYTTYYVHHGVRYPRYLCYDCHRPSQWAWWDGFDPYYSRCSVFTFAVNWNWCWGPSYWFGYVPYYAFVYRSDCPPRYRSCYSRGLWHSSWNGPRQWSSLWGGPLTRHKSAPPVGYVPPTKYDPRRGWRPGSDPLPPGFLADNPRLRGIQRELPLGRNSRLGDNGRTLRGDRGGRIRDLRELRAPEREPLRGNDGRGTPRLERPRRDDRPLSPSDEPTISRPPRSGRPRGDDPRLSRSDEPMFLRAPRFTRPRGDDRRDPVSDQPQRSQPSIERPLRGERPFMRREPSFPGGSRIERPQRDNGSFLRPNPGREDRPPPQANAQRRDLSPPSARWVAPRVDVSRFAGPRFSGRRGN